MRKILFITLTMTLLCFAPGYAQSKQKGNHVQWHKQYVDFKVKYIIQEAGLREDQKKAFTALYTKMEEEKSAASRSARAAEKVVKNNAKATEAQYDAAANAMRNLKLKEAQIENKYYPRFRAMLTAKQSYLMKRAEKRFQRKLMKMQGEKKK